MALGVDYNPVFDQDEEDLLIHIKVLRKAEEFVHLRNTAELNELAKIIMGAAEQRVITHLFN